MLRFVPVVLLASGVAFADGKAKATKPAPPPPAPGKVVVTGGPPVQPHKEGDYGGVTPGAPPATKPAGKAQRPPAKGTLAWIGFEAKDGGAQVFLQSVAPFELAQQVVGAQLIVSTTLPRLGQNTWRQVDTRYFDNPLAGIQARVVGAARATKDRAAHPAGVEVRITFKNPKDAREATVRTATEQDGMYYAYLTFPEGTGDAAKPQPTVQEPEQ